MAVERQQTMHVGVCLAGMGLSIIDAEPTELLYVSITGLVMDVVTSCDWHLSELHIQVCIFPFVFTKANKLLVRCDLANTASLSFYQNMQQVVACRVARILALRILTACLCLLHASTAQQRLQVDNQTSFGSPVLLGLASSNRELTSSVPGDSSGGDSPSSHRSGASRSVQEGSPETRSDGDVNSAGGDWFMSVKVRATMLLRQTWSCLVLRYHMICA